MNYCRWKRRIAICGILLLAFPPALLLTLVDGLVEYRQENEIPVEIKYPLSEVPEDQAVLVQRYWLIGIMMTIQRDVVVNKEGRWKLVNYYRMSKDEIHGKHDTNVELWDAILQDERIPWQKKRIGMNPVLLERALNMPKVKFKKGAYHWKEYSHGAIENYLIDNSPERQRIYYGTGTPKKGDYTPLYIQCKMKQLCTLGDQAVEKRRAIRE